MRSAPREAFLPEQLREFAYEDAPLPIEESHFQHSDHAVASAETPTGNPLGRSSEFSRSRIGATDSALTMTVGDRG